VFYNTSSPELAGLQSIAEMDVYVRNELAFYTLVDEILFTIVHADNASAPVRRLVLDVYASSELSPADILVRLASASDCNFLPPACVPTTSSTFGKIGILNLDIVVAAAPQTGPLPLIASLPPIVDISIHSVVEAVDPSYVCFCVHPKQSGSLCHTDALDSHSTYHFVYCHPQEIGRPSIPFESAGQSNSDASAAAVSKLLIFFCVMFVGMLWL
jgi:hypothetical protein